MSGRHCSSFSLQHRIPLYLLIFSLLLSLAGTAFSQVDYGHPELNWRTIETKHFYVDYHQGERRTAEVVARIAEEAYGPITKLYDHKPSQKVSLVLWDTDDYSNGETYFYDNKINIWASSLDFELRGTHDWLRNVITHEFTHDVQMQTSMKFGRRIPAIYLQWLGYQAERRPDVLYGAPNVMVSYPISGINIPAWFAEGVAQYNDPGLKYNHDTWDSHRDMILREYVLNNKMLTPQEMGGFGKTSLGNESTYNAGFALVRYLAAKYGPDVLRRLSHAMRSIDAVTIDYAFEKVLGKSEQQVYDEWRDYLRKIYTERTAKIRETLHDGEVIRDVGFANFYPVFSPDGKQIAYCSNKHRDYFGTSSVYVYNLADSSEKAIVDGVASELSWSPDGTYLVYDKTTPYNKHWDDLDDIYSYDLKKDSEHRLTHGLRARYPSLSSDGKRIAFVAGDDGTLNLYAGRVDLQHNKITDITELTHYKNGEQIYTTRWSNSGGKITFSYSLRSSRLVGIYSFADSSVKFITPDGQDSRDPVFVDHDSCVVYSSDRSGIFNLYKQNLYTDSTVAFTNVVGGAFMPTISASGAIAYSSYKWSGYKIACLGNSDPVPNPPKYEVDVDPPPSVAYTNVPVADTVNDYNDLVVPDYKSTPYKSTLTSTSFYPVILYDDYNLHPSFLDQLKLGAYFSSSDVLDKYDIFGGITINKLLERDIFFQLDYNDKIPLLSSLGIYPQLTLQAYNVSRQTSTPIGIAQDTISTPLTFDLTEVSLAFGGPIFDPSLNLSLGFTFDMYGAKVSGFIYPPTGLYFGSVGYNYFLGRTFFGKLDFDGIEPTRNSWVNPLGVRSWLSVSAALDKLSNGLEQNTSLIIPIYENFNFVQAEFMSYMAFPLFRRDDALAAKLHVGYTFGPEINSFFDFYAGGITGMKGYSYYSLGGNKMAFFNLTYRYPLFRDVNKQFLQFYLSDIYLLGYGDIGNAWRANVADTHFKKDVGAELRLSGFSFYSYPTAIFFDAAYSFSKFTTQFQQTTASNVAPLAITYGHEWKFYFGLTFSFDIVDFERHL